MLAKFFIDRPIAAWVISIVILIAGLASALTLPIAQYPEITPPTVQVSCQYPGASAGVVADTVAAPIEQQVNGVEGMMYMSSQSANDGTYNLTVTFELGTNLDMAQVLVQNRVSQAMPTLPDAVKATGVTTKKKSPSILLVVNLFAETNPETGKPAFDQLFLSNYATIQLKDELARLKGVGDVTLFGEQDYSMRVWLDPDKMSSRGLAADDVVRVLKEQNVQVAAGQIGQPPVPRGQDFQYTMTTLGRLTDPKQFEAIVLKTGTKGEVTYLRDVARLELGAKNQDTLCTLDGKPSAGIAIFQLPGSNALEVADRVKEKMEELKRRFPAGLNYLIAYDTTPFVEESIHEVFKTLRDAVILVAIVVLLFLQDWRSVMLPLIDVAVSLIGTFAVMKLLGFSLNNLSLFGLVLAIGIVVDDAIVVLENIERWLAMGYPVREATIKAMNEITGPIVAITLVLCSVFLPAALLVPGISGQFYQQFALTIAASMILSAINAMTMTPARAASVFKHHNPGAHGAHGPKREALPPWGVALIFGWVGMKLLEPLLGGPLANLFGGESGWRGWASDFVLMIPGVLAGWLLAAPVNAALGTFFRGFNWVFDRATAVYGRVVGWSLRLCFLVLLLYGGLLALTGYGFTRVPIGFIPEQDKGFLIVNVQLPDSASLERTSEVVERLEKIARETPGVAHTVSLPGYSVILGANSSNFGAMFVTLVPFHDRRGGELGSPQIGAVLRRRFYEEVEEARVAVFGAPAVEGLGSAGGFKLMVQDRGSVGLAALAGQADTLAEQGNRQPGLVGLFNSFRADTPQLYVDIDRTKAKTLGVELTAVFNALQVYLGGYYVNDFNFEGRTWQVNVQAEPAFRLTAEAVRNLKVRNAKGDMVPLGTVADVRDASGPVLLTRYNMYPAAAINGAALPGVSTGTVISTMEALSDKVLPSSMTSEWTELTYLQKQEGAGAILAFIGAVVLVFLVLAFKYESWSLPTAVLLVVPMCLLAAIAGVAMARMDINIFVQVGFIVLVGLAAKNAILVVEFAAERERAGAKTFDATLEAGTTRLRPIIMTSLAFILGVFPLVIGQGAGAEMRRTLGTAVFSGMIGVTLFGIFLTPVFYYVISRLWGVGGPATPAPEPDAAGTATTAPAGDGVAKQTPSAAPDGSFFSADGGGAKPEPAAPPPPDGNPPAGGTP